MKFLQNIALSGSMEIRRGKRRLAPISLRGTSNALNATVECQMSVLRAASDSRAETAENQQQEQAQTSIRDLLRAHLKTLSSGGAMVTPNTVACNTDLEHVM